MIVMMIFVVLQTTAAPGRATVARERDNEWGHKEH